MACSVFRLLPSKFQNARFLANNKNYSWNHKHCQDISRIHITLSCWCLQSNSYQIIWKLSINTISSDYNGSYFVHSSWLVIVNQEQLKSHYVSIVIRFVDFYVFALVSRMTKGLIWQNCPETDQSGAYDDKKSFKWKYKFMLPLDCL